MSTPRIRRLYLAGVALIGCLALGLLGAASAHAETKSFSSTGTEQEFKVPAGVTSVQVEAVGSEGGTAVGAAHGGVGAVVTGEVSVTPEGVLYVEVGGVPFNGGGFSSEGGSGGGASDVRKVSIGGEPSPGNKASLESRLLVAAGGGGGGLEDYLHNGCAGGAGGAAAERGATGTNCGYPPGEFGGAGEASKGGAGGVTYLGESQEPDFDGEDGAFGVGGEGALIGFGYGGGGGGGLYGGGGGGAQPEQEPRPPNSKAGNGGGGGGSNLVPEGGEAKLNKHKGEPGYIEPSVTITYTVPPACSMAEGTGTYLKSGEKGRFTVRDHLSKTLTDTQMLQVNTASGEARFGLTKLSSAKCEAVAGGFKFSGEGPSRYYSKTGYTISFSLTVKGRKASFSAKLSNGSIVVNEEENALTKSNEVIH